MTKPSRYSTPDYSKLKVTSNLNRGEKPASNDDLAKLVLDCFGKQIRDWLTKLDQQQNKSKDK